MTAGEGDAKGSGAPQDAMGGPAGASPAHALPDSGAGGGEAAGTSDLITIEDFGRVQLRVARILQAEPHPNADRLLRLQIDLGDERRQLVAGIAKYYAPEELIGREIVVVANLQPAKLRGELSQGMLLAASDEEGVALLAPSRSMRPGARVS